MHTWHELKLEEKKNHEIVSMNEEIFMNKSKQIQSQTF